MADDSDLEKTEPASERRLEKAREEGQTARSRELVTFLLLLVGAGSLWAGAGWMYQGLGSVLHEGLGFERNVAFDTQAMLARAGAGVFEGLLTITPIFLLLVIVAILGSVLLGGFRIVGKPMVPNFTKLDPIKGLGRIFSMNTLVELIKALLKAVLVGGIATWIIRYNIDAMLNLMQLAPGTALAESLRLIVTCCMVIIASLVLVAGLDAPYQIWHHLKQLRMTRDEVRREHKENDGDPHLRARIRQQQRAMARGRMMSAVPNADVVVTNPTHYAVALRYEEGDGAAPKVVAKGAGELAARIRELAGQHRVPLLEAPPLARALYRHVELDAEIPAALYQAVAQVLAWVYQLRQSRTQAGVPDPEAPADLPVPDALDPHTRSS